MKLNSIFVFFLQEKKHPIDVRLIDFQLIRRGSPVIDLSYCIYAGGSKTIFDDLEYFLEIYYASLSKTLKEYSLDSEKLYTFDTLKSEWKDHCVYGMVMAMYLWSVKLIDEAEVKDIKEFHEINGKGSDSIIDHFQKYFDIPAFSSFMDDMLLHAYERGYL